MREVEDGKHDCVGKDPCLPSSDLHRRTGDWQQQLPNRIATWLLFNTGTVTAATFDLRSGIGRTPNRSTTSPRKPTCDIAPAGMPHPLWTAFYIRITGGIPDCSNYFSAISAMLHRTSHRTFVCFRLWHRRNGKSTFINTLSRVFRDYPTVPDMGTFIATRAERHPTDLANECGARLVVAQETQRGQHWDKPRSRRSPAATGVTRDSCGRIFSTSCRPSSSSLSVTISHG